MSLLEVMTTSLRAAQGNLCSPLATWIRVRILSLLVVTLVANESTAQESVRNAYIESGWNAIKSENYQEAESLFRTALKEAEKARPQDATLPNSLLGLGNALYEQGEYVEAESVLRRCLKVVEQVEKENVGVLNTTVDRLTDVLRWLGKFDEAERILKLTISRREKTYGKTHWTVGYSKIAFARVLQWEGKIAEAEVVGEQAIAIYERNVAEKRITDEALAAPLNNLGRTYKAQGKYTEAKALFIRALGVYEKKRQEDNIASTLSNLAELKCALQEFDDAILMQRRVVDIYQKTQPADSRSLALAKCHFAVYLQIQGKQDEARILDDEALKVLRSSRRYGTVASADRALKNAKGFFEGGNYVGAEFCYRFSIICYGDTLGPDDSAVADVNEKLATALTKQGRNKEAAVYSLRAERIRADVQVERKP